MVAGALPASAHAAQFAVTSTADTIDVAPGNGACATAGGVCTLRAAVGEANALFGADEIVVPAGTYQTGSALSVTSSMTITGPAGARATIVDGAPSATVLDVNGAGTATVRGLTLTGGARGVQVSATDLALDQVAIRDNTLTAPGQVDGAGMNITGTGKVLMTRSAVVNNAATSNSLDAVGGGIRIFSGGALTAEASTIAGNSVAAPAIGEASFGGGIAAVDATVVLRHVTLLNNSSSAGSAASYGGNLYLQGGTATVTDAIISGGQAAAGYQNCGGTIKPTPAGRNIDSGTTCGFGAGQLSSTDPQLEPLADHGGPTDTAPPKLAGPARDQAGTCPGGGLDQRGAPAPSGAACDVGAAELSTDLAVTLEASRADVAPGGDVTYIARVTNNGPDAALATTLDVTPAGAGQVLLANASTGTCTLVVRCELGTLARGASLSVTVVLRAGAAGTLAPVARVSVATPDPQPANDTAGLTTPVTPAGAAGAGADRTAPALGPLRLSGRVRSGRTATLRATLSEAATVTLRVERLVPGRRAGNRCSSTRRRGARCTLKRRAGTFTVRAAAGTPRLVLPARLAKRRLAPGRYRLSATATDAAGNRSRARTLIITIRP